jgi:hypothetical protein
MVRHERHPPEYPIGEIQLIFCSQSAAQADKYILDCDLAFFKPLGLLYHDLERPAIKRIYRDWVDPVFQGKDDFWIVDVAVSYRLPKRHGFISAGVKNLFDQEFMYFDTNWKNATLQPGLIFFSSLTLTLP